VVTLAGRATETGTARYARRLQDGAPGLAAGHFRSALGLTMSSIGAGTYLGDLSDEVDARYRSSLAEAVRLGANVIDTAVNYRAQRSELAVGRAVGDLIASGEFKRDELVIISKGGFIAYHLARPEDPVEYIYEQFIQAGVMQPDDLAGGIHCMAPAYLGQQISWSLRNLGLRTLDIYCIHNPETQLAFVDSATLRNRLQLAFSHLEEEVAAGRIGCYGVSTWEGLRRPPMSAGYVSLELMVRLAREVGGEKHHLRVVQFPLNAAMLECVNFRNQPVNGKLASALEAARDLGLTVTASASIMQGRIAGRIAASLSVAFPDFDRDIGRALQFTRSLPGVTVALTGMSRKEHAREDMEVAFHPPAPEQAQRLAHMLAR
jgi:aryl-alcohol dehydrogenase-like predicted oxidoreductase